MFSQLIFKPVDQSTFSKYPVAGAPAPSNITQCSLPSNTTDSRVIFNIKAPDAKKVQIDLGKKYDLSKRHSRFLESNY